MQLTIDTEDYELLKMLLSKEEVGARVEIHHCRTREYKDVLKKREKQLQSLLERLAQAVVQPGPMKKAQYEGSGLHH
jgi:hypothetical protein